MAPVDLARWWHVARRRLRSLFRRATVDRELDDELRYCGAPGVVLSHRFWRREFGGDPAAVGRTLTINGHAFQIVG